MKIHQHINHLNQKSIKMSNKYLHQSEQVKGKVNYNEKSSRNVNHLPTIQRDSNRRNLVLTNSSLISTPSPETEFKSKFLIRKLYCRVGVRC